MCFLTLCAFPQAGDGGGDRKLTLKLEMDSPPRATEAAGNSDSAAGGGVVVGFGDDSVAVEVPSAALTGEYCVN